MSFFNQIAGAAQTAFQQADPPQDDPQQEQSQPTERNEPTEPAQDNPDQFNVGGLVSNLTKGNPVSRLGNADNFNVGGLLSEFGGGNQPATEGGTQGNPNLNIGGILGNLSGGKINTEGVTGGQKSGDLLNEAVDFVQGQMGQGNQVWNVYPRLMLEQRRFGREAQR